MSTEAVGGVEMIESIERKPVRKPRLTEQNKRAPTAPPPRPSQLEPITPTQCPLVSTQPFQSPPTPAISSPGVNDEPPPQEPKSLLRTLADRANHGDKQALEELRRLLDENSGFWKAHGNLSRYAELAWMQLLAEDSLKCESIERHLKYLRTELAGAKPSMVEKLLTDRVVCCFLALHYAELALARPGSVSPEQMTIRTRRCESAEKRYLSALRTLTRLRATMPQGLNPAAGLRTQSAEPEQQELA